MLHQYEHRKQRLSNSNKDVCLNIKLQARRQKHNFLFIP